MGIVLLAVKVTVLLNIGVVGDQVKLIACCSVIVKEDGAITQEDEALWLSHTIIFQ